MDAKDKAMIREKIEDLKDMVDKRERWIRQDLLTIKALEAQLAEAK